jgi:hypothetical protein
MITPSPPIDSRTAADITAEVRTLLRLYAPSYGAGGSGPDGSEPDPDPLGAALVGIFGRFAELIIQRLNQVPQKNFLAFLDLVGASQLPPRPARAPLTFSLAAGTLVPAIVPQGTQVAAQPGPGENAPTIFETEAECVVTPATLTAVFCRDPDLDSYADLTALTTSAGAPAQGLTAFHGNRLVDHVVYLGFSDLLVFTGITECSVTFLVTTGHGDDEPADERSISWEIWDGSTWVPAPVAANGDTTKNLTTSGDVRFGVLPAVPPTDVNGVVSRWLRGRLETPVNQTAASRAGMVRAGDLGRVRSISAIVTVSRTDVRPDAAFSNSSPLDVTREFFPFGTTPRFGDALFVQSDEAFSAPGAAVTMDLVVVNPAQPPGNAGPVNPPPVNATGNPKLSWELWTGSIWSVVGVSQAAGPSTPGFADGTKALTQTGTVAFTTPAQVGTTTVNGIEGYWLRVRIVGGDYGTDAHYVLGGDGGFTLVLPTFGPPILSPVTLQAAFTKAGGPEVVLTSNDFTFADVSKNHDTADPGDSFAPFVAMADDRPTLYFGFELPLDLATFPNRPVSFLVRSADLQYGQLTSPISPLRAVGAGMPGNVVTYRLTVTNPGSTPVRAVLGTVGTSWQPRPLLLEALDLAGGEARAFPLTVIVPPDVPLGSSDTGLLVVLFASDPTRFDVATFQTFAASSPPDRAPVTLAWQSWNGSAFAPLTVQDGTSNLTRTGTVQFLAAPDFSARADFGLGPRYWIAARHEKGDFDLDPRLVRVLLNTTMAAQTVTFGDEVLGSSDGSKSLRFRATRSPILPGQQLDVREPELPAAAEREALEFEEGEDAVTVVLDTRGNTQDVFVRWHEVPDFYASSPRDRHYVVDRLAGEIRFGDGLNGLVPPIGVGNVRLTLYQTGGGSSGNRAAGSIVQLKTTVPYVDKVINTEPAAGGADAEDVASVIDRVPRAIRHGGRAVTSEDFEDLACLASPEVARARCVPLANLLLEPLGAALVPGEVSVIVVPRSADVKPLPSLELLSTVQDYVEGVSGPTVHLSVVGPLYVRVNVTAELGLVSLEGVTTVLSDVQQRIAGFLHPLTGGADLRGWDFGRRPHESDFHALIESVPGVDHVRSLDLDEVEDIPGTIDTGRFLVYAGTPRIIAVFEEA